MASPEALAIQAEQREQARLAVLRQIDERLARLEALLSGDRTAPAPAHGIDPEAATAAQREAVTPTPKPRAAK